MKNHSTHSGSIKTRERNTAIAKTVIEEKIWLYYSCEQNTARAAKAPPCGSYASKTHAAYLAGLNKARDGRFLSYRPNLLLPFTILPTEVCLSYTNIFSMESADNTTNWIAKNLYITLLQRIGEPCIHMIDATNPIKSNHWPTTQRFLNSYAENLSHLMDPQYGVSRERVQTLMLATWFGYSVFTDNQLTGHTTAASKIIREIRSVESEHTSTRHGE